MTTGMIHSYDHWETRGLVVDDAAGAAYLIYPSSFVSTERGGIDVGQRVMFDVLHGLNGLTADNVRRI